MKRSIIELIRIPSEQHDLAWLKESLQAAIDLELATLPPYLCAFWSIKDTGNAYNLIRTIVQEEMLHLGLVCNMLTALECVPILNNNIPTYPGPLPGGVRPWLNVFLAGLSKPYLNKVCMQIEYPEDGPVALSFKRAAIEEHYPTIGDFYDAILAAFQTLNPPLSATNQLDGATLNHYPLYKVPTLDEVKTAIKEIKDQGEGTSQSPESSQTDEDGNKELAHYYKFAEIFHGKSLEKQNDGSWAYTGAVIPFPDVYPMTPIPPGGYVKPSPDVAAKLLDFNQTFTKMLNSLQSAWEKGSEGDLSAAIHIMFSLKPKAVALMEIELPGGKGVYGPDFLLAQS